MLWILLLILIVIVAAIAILKTKAGKQKAPESRALPYFKKNALLNEVEQVLFQRLTQATPGYHVMVQVRLADFVGVKGGGNKYKWLNPLKQKSVDFLICSETLEPLVVIELDGKSHEREDRKKADNQKNEILDAAQIKWIRYKTNAIPTAEELRKTLNE